MALTSAEKIFSKWTSKSVNTVKTSSAFDEVVSSAGPAARQCEARAWRCYFNIHSESYLAATADSEAVSELISSYEAVSKNRDDV